MFLAGIWSAIEASAQDSHEASDERRTSVAALHHSRAFIYAHSPADEDDSSEGKQRDFQVILPSVLIALQSTDRTVREAATRLLSAISAARRPTKNVQVYAFDSIYRRSRMLSLFRRVNNY